MYSRVYLIENGPTQLVFVLEHFCPVLEYCCDLLLHSFSAIRLVLVVLLLPIDCEEEGVLSFGEIGLVASGFLVLLGWQFLFHDVDVFFFEAVLIDVFVEIFNPFLVFNGLYL